MSRTLRLAVRGPLDALDARARRVLLDRAGTGGSAVRERTGQIIDRVRAEGDAALIALSREFDGVESLTIEVPKEMWRAALATLDPALRRALERAARNIRQVHEAFRPVASEVTTADGIIVGRRPDPLGRVGVYAPGGRATYPSSLLMGVVPARVAGVGEIIVCSPPGRDGVPSRVLLAAAELAAAIASLPWAERRGCCRNGLRYRHHSGSRPHRRTRQRVCVAEHADAMRRRGLWRRRFCVLNMIFRLALSEGVTFSPSSHRRARCGVRRHRQSGALSRTPASLHHD